MSAHKREYFLPIGQELFARPRTLGLAGARASQIDQLFEKAKCRASILIDLVVHKKETTNGLTIEDWSNFQALERTNSLPQTSL